MNYGLLPGFGRKRQTTRRVVGVLRTPQVAPAGYASPLAVAAGAVIVNPGSTSAGVLTEYLRVMGAGRIHWLSAYTADGTSRDIRTMLTLDDRDIVDHTAAGLAATGTGPILLGTGNGDGNGLTVGYHTLDFTSSCVIRASGSLTESGGFRLAYVVELLE